MLDVSWWMRHHLNMRPPYGRTGPASLVTQILYWQGPDIFAFSKIYQYNARTKRKSAFLKELINDS